MGSGIAIDRRGNSYVTGFFSGTATFGAGEANETELTASGGDDFFVAKYDRDGRLLWATQAGGTSGDRS
jgi:Beta-propeller repeat